LHPLIACSQPRSMIDVTRPDKMLRGRLVHDLAIHDRLHPSQHKIGYFMKDFGSQDYRFHPLADHCISHAVGQYLVVDRKEKGG
jgi:hypothetical protein